MHPIERAMKPLFKYRVFTVPFNFVERKMKEWIFDCQSCGNCVLSHTGFVCPMRCPKDLRNGPCGGPNKGMCEVDPEKRCVWDEAWENTVKLERVDLLTEHFERAPDWSLYGTSAWDNMLEGRLGDDSLFDTMFRKGVPITKEWPRVFGVIIGSWWNMVTGGTWRRYEGRPNPKREE